MAHGQWTEAEARGVPSALAKSGLSVEAFVGERGLVPQRIYWWKRKLERKARPQTASAMALLPARVVEETPKRGEPVTVLQRSGHMVKVGRGFDEEAFARAVAILERG